uniref:Uncharacterized protein n=1 Tax=Ditylenchus dipsaci TaxID=166011 RepID=A0A915E6B8_9BILA
MKQALHSKLGNVSGNSELSALVDEAATRMAENNLDTACRMITKVHVSGLCCNAICGFEPYVPKMPKDFVQQALSYPVDGFENAVRRAYSKSTAN